MPTKAAPGSAPAAAATTARDEPALAASSAPEFTLLRSPITAVAAVAGIVAPVIPEDAHAIAVRRHRQPRLPLVIKSVIVVDLDPAAPRRTAVCRLPEKDIRLVPRGRADVVIDDVDVAGHRIDRRLW